MIYKKVLDVFDFFDNKVHYYIQIKQIGADDQALKYTYRKIDSPPAFLQNMFDGGFESARHRI